MEKLTRKNFLKSSALLCGALSFQTLNKPILEMTANTAESPSSIKRGTWLRKKAIQKNDIKLISENINCNIIFNEHEYAAIKQAVSFLADDIAKLSGQTPLINNKDENNSCIRIATYPAKNLPEFITAEKLQGKWESFCITTDGKDIWIVGSDFRGTIFGVYTFCERMGIDPLYHWTGYKPELTKNLVIKNINHYSPPPVFKYRGFFHDDEDILPRPFDFNGEPYRFGFVPLEWYQRFFETALRLKMNMVAPYTRVHRQYEVQKCASDWGLFYTSHHYDILLSNPFGIERFRLAEKRNVSTDWNWLTNKEGMMRYWQGGVQENKAVAAIWPIGLRGIDDHGYKFPANTSESEQSVIFRDALEAQVKIVKNEMPAETSPVFHFTLYTEMLDKFLKNRENFNVPKEAIIVWPDDNTGIMRALPQDKGKWRHGVYYHLAYYGGQISVQNMHVVNPYYIAQEFEKIITSGATEFLLVNVSEMREFVMEARMIADICEYHNLTDTKDAADKYIQWWSEEYFPSAAKEIAIIYKDYYKLMNAPANCIFGNEMVSSILKMLVKKQKNEKYQPLQQQHIDTLNNRYNNHKNVLNKIEKIWERLNKEEQQFLFENIKFPLLTDFRSIEAALVLLQTINETNDKTIDALVRKALFPLEKLESEILRAQRPPFENWYQKTWIRQKYSPLNIHRPYELLNDFIAGKPLSPPANNKKGNKIQEAQIWSDFLETLKDKILP